MWWERVIGLNEGPRWFFYTRKGRGLSIFGRTENHFTAYWRKLRELKERVSILTGDVERISAMPEDIEMRAKLLGMVEDFMEHP